MTSQDGRGGLTGLPAFRLVLPYPPSANKYWRFPRGLSRPIVSEEARAYKLRASAEARYQGAKRLSCAVSVEIDVYRPRKIGDLDNTAKVALDALKGVAWDDDDQIVALQMRRFDDKDMPRLEVRVEGLVT